MQRHRFSRDFKIETVRLVSERGVSVAQAAWDLDVHENALRNWVKDFSVDPKQAFPGPLDLEYQAARSAVVNTFQF